MVSHFGKESSDTPPRSRNSDVSAADESVEAIANDTIAHSILRIDQFAMGKSNCEYLLGVLTIPDHKDLRIFARQSWIKHLPLNVCYLFLYDKPEDISEEESFDGLSLNSNYKGKGVRFGEKLYNFYMYVHGEVNFEGVKYIVKMDDDVVPCPGSMFPFLANNEISTTTYAGYFHNGGGKLGFDKRADELFVLIGRDLLNKIAAKQYCSSDNKEWCDERGQLYDTNAGGTSLGIWLSTFETVHCLPLNGLLEDLLNNPARTQKNGSLLYHPTKTVRIAQEKFAQCCAT
jgi:hypothetical protein